MSHVVARIGKPHGVLGEVTVRLHTDDPAARFVVGTRFAVEAAPGAALPQRLTLRSVRVHNGTWLLAFQEATDRTSAERLRGTHLLTLDDASDEGRTSEGANDSAAEDGWYQTDLVGLAVVRVDGTPVGTVSGLLLGSAQDLLEVALAGGGTAYIPFVRALVPVVDLPGGRILVDPPSGLLELNG